MTKVIKILIKIIIAMVIIMNNASSNNNDNSYSNENYCDKFSTSIAGCTSVSVFLSSVT